MDAESPDLKSEEEAEGPFATESEIRTAIQTLSGAPEAQKIAVAAQFLLDKHPVLKATVEPADLIQDAFTAILEGRRKWSLKRVQFHWLVVGVMKSLVFNLTRKANETQPQLISESEFQDQDDSSGNKNFLENVPSSQATPEGIRIAIEDDAEEQAVIAIIRAQFEPGDDALKIFELLLDRLRKQEIKLKLGMDDKRFWAADRRLTRSIQTHATRRNNHDK